MTSCQWLSQIEQGQEGVWGAEAAALASVVRAGVPTLPGFVVSREAMLAYFLQPELRSALTKSAKGLSVKKPELFAGAAKEMRQAILATPLPLEIRKSIGAFLNELEDQVLELPGKGLPVHLIAQNEARSVHQGAPKSLAAADLLIRQLFALDFSEQALFARYRNEDHLVPAAYAILVQFAPESVFSGDAVQFDADAHDETIITITVAHHDKAHAAADADIYRYDLTTGHQLSAQEAVHQWAHKKGKHVSPRHTLGAAKLDERQRRLLARFVKRAQEQCPTLQRFHWQMLLESVVVSGVEPLVAQPTPTPSGRVPLAVGHAAHVGAVHGPVRSIRKKADWEAIQDGEIVIVEHLAERDMPKLAGIAGLITESGHGTSAEASVAARLGVPAVTGVATARQLFRDGQLVTLDGAHGAVYAGRTEKYGLAPHNVNLDLPITGTKIYAALEDAMGVTGDTLRDCDGIGMLRGEFILRALGVHPKEVLHQGMAQEYVELLAEGVDRAARAAGQRPVIYQLHDLAEHAFHGWKTWRRGSHEPNRLIGYRGSHRLLSEPELVEMELKALAHVQARGHENISVMLPMVRSLEELKGMRRLIKGIAPHLVEHLWVRVETPALAISIDELIALEPAGVLFDVPALATLITGMDGENHQMEHHRDQADPAVLEALRYAIASCRAAGVATSILNEKESPRAEVVETAVRAGVVAVCARPEDTAWLHGLIASIEQRMLLEHLIDHTNDSGN